MEFIYLHGFASGPSSTKALTFKNKFKKIGVSLKVPDLEGGKFENMTLSSQMDIIFNLLDQSEAEKVCIIGSSMGGYLAALIAQLRTEVDAIYLMAPGFNFLERWMQSLKLDFDNETCWDSMIPIFHYRHDETRYISTDIFKDARKWSSINLTREVPTRIVHGINDEVVPINESKKFISCRPWGTLEELNSDHGLLSHLDWLVDDCMLFFKKLGFFSC